MFRSLHHSGAGRLWLLFSGAVFRPWCLVAVVGLAWPGGPMASGGADSTALGGLACGGNDRAGGRGAGFHCHPAAGGLWVRIPLSRPLTWPASLDERRASSSSRCGRPMRSGTLSSRVTTIRLLGGAARVRLAGPARPSYCAKDGTGTPSSLLLEPARRACIALRSWTSSRPGSRNGHAIRPPSKQGATK